MYHKLNLEHNRMIWAMQVQDRKLSLRETECHFNVRNLQIIPERQGIVQKQTKLYCFFGLFLTSSSLHACSMSLFGVPGVIPE